MNARALVIAILLAQPALAGADPSVLPQPLWHPFTDPLAYPAWPANPIPRAARVPVEAPVVQAQAKEPAVNMTEPPVIDSSASPQAPRWDIRAGAVFLRRQNPDGPVLLFNALTGAPVLDASQFQFNFEAGPEVEISRRLGERFQLEVRFFSVDSWQSQIDNVNLVNHYCPVQLFVKQWNALSGSRL